MSFKFKNDMIFKIIDMKIKKYFIIIYMNYKEITSDEYQKLLENKKNIFNNTFKNTNKLVEEKKQILKTDPDAIIRKEEKNEDIEKISDSIYQKINNADALKNIADEIKNRKIVDRFALKDLSDKIDLKNDQTSKPSYKFDYQYFIKNPHILADKIVEIYDNNPDAKVYNPTNKENKVKIQNVVNKIEKDEKIDKQYKEFINEFRNIPNNTKIKYDYEIYKKLVLDRINDEDSTSTNIKEIGKQITKKTIKKLIGQDVNEYKTIKIDKDALKKNILKIRYNNNGRKLNNRYLHDDMIISNNMKNAIMKNINVNKLSKNEYHVYTFLNKYKNDDTNLLISSYLAGNTSTNLYNTINKNLYNKLENNEITKQHYNNILQKLIIIYNGN